MEQRDNEQMEKAINEAKKNKYQGGLDNFIDV